MNSLEWAWDMIGRPNTSTAPEARVVHGRHFEKQPKQGGAHTRFGPLVFKQKRYRHKITNRPAKKACIDTHAQLENWLGPTTPSLLLGPYMALPQL